MREHIQRLPTRTNEDHADLRVTAADRRGRRASVRLRTDRGETRRRDGILQVTYEGHPLYLNGGDTKPGSLRGDHTQEFGGRWYVVPIRGVKARPA